MAQIYTRTEILDKIKLYEDALEKLAVAQSYTLDTGQSVQKVTRASIPELESMVKKWEARLDEYDNNGSNSSFIYTRFN